MFSKILPSLAVLGLSQGHNIRGTNPGFTHVLDNDALTRFIHDEYSNSVIDNLSKFIELPNLSPNYDADWRENGVLLEALQLMQTWAENQGVVGLRSHIYNNFTQEDCRSAPPTLLVTIDGTIDDSDTAVLYGHADKQPMMTESWTVTNPMVPLLAENNTKLYGRGAADDGYSFYTNILAVKALQAQNVSHSRVVILSETEEESGSPNLPAFLDFMRDELNIKSSFLGILDTGGHDLDHFWLTTSLRGMIVGRIRVDITDHTVHAGSAGGIVPSPMRIVLDLISSRLENFKTGEVFADALTKEVTEYQMANAHAMAEFVGAGVYNKLGFIEGAGPNYNGKTPTTEELAEILIQSTLKSQLTIVAFNHETKSNLGDGAQAIYPFAEVEISIRTAPGIDTELAMAELQTLLEADSPYGAAVTFEPVLSIPSFLAPEPPSWLEFTMAETAPKLWDGAPGQSLAVGGTVPMMSFFQDVFGDLDVVATGVLSGETGHHAPDEFLHIPTAERVTAMLATILAAHCEKANF